MLNGARPIKNLEILNHYALHNYTEYSLEHYSNIFFNWIVNTNNKTLLGLDNFLHRHFVQGTSQSFDNFVLRHAKKQIVNFQGEFQYHACISKYLNRKTLAEVNELTNGQALLISFPFSDTGSQHLNFEQILTQCNLLNIPVCLDIAYWGIAKNIKLDLTQWPCIEEVTCSLSKPFYTLETHRIGIRFNREYVDDGVCMINEVDMANKYSISLAIHYMNKFNSDFMWQKYQPFYYDVCKELNLKPTNTIIFGLGGQEYSHFNRGLPGNNRVCISNNLSKKIN